MNDVSHVVDVSEANFQAAVIEESSNRPVLVDLWAPWCGPCKTLGPALEEAAGEYAGAFLLAKVDVEKNPTLGQAFRAQSIPMVVALFEGRPVDSFTGALSGAEIKTFINQVLTTCGLPVPGREEAPEGEDVAEKEAFWHARLVEDTKDGEALLELGRLLLRTDREAEAGEFLEQVGVRMPQFSAAKAALKLRSLMSEVRDAGGAEAITRQLATDPAEPCALYLNACVQGIQGHYEPSLETLIHMIAAGDVDLRKRAKNAASVVFGAAGRDIPRIEELRRQLARLLF